MELPYSPPAHIIVKPHRKISRALATCVVQMEDVNQLRKSMLTYAEGDDSAGDAICVALTPAIRRGTAGLLRPTDADADDIVQDTLIAVLRYLRRSKVVPDNPAAFAVTVSRNRAYNLQIWRQRRTAKDIDELAGLIPHIAASPLDLVLKSEKQALVREAFAALTAECRDLLRALSVEEVTVESVRRKLGLATVQGVYHRRNVCIKKAQTLLKRRLLGCRLNGDADPEKKPPYPENRESGSE